MLGAARSPKRLDNPEVYWCELPTAREAVEAIALEAKNKTSERDRTDLLSRSFRFLGGELKGTADETLFLELALRGYDLSKLREEETPAEIVKFNTGV